MRLKSVTYTRNCLNVTRLTCFFFNLFSQFMDGFPHRLGVGHPHAFSHIWSAVSTILGFCIKYSSRENSRGRRFTGRARTSTTRRAGSMKISPTRKHRVPYCLEQIWGYTRWTVEAGQRPDPRSWGRNFYRKRIYLLRVLPWDWYPLLDCQTGWSGINVICRIPASQSDCPILRKYSRSAISKWNIFCSAYTLHPLLSATE